MTRVDFNKISIQLRKKHIFAKAIHTEIEKRHYLFCRKLVRYSNWAYSGVIDQGILYNCNLFTICFGRIKNDFEDLQVVITHDAHAGMKMIISL